MSLKENVLLELNSMQEVELKQVADYLAFLKYSSRRTRTSQVDETEISKLYSEFNDEDSELSEEGMREYANALSLEDTL